MSANIEDTLAKPLPHGMLHFGSYINHLLSPNSKRRTALFNNKDVFNEDTRFYFLFDCPYRGRSNSFFKRTSRLTQLLS